MLVNKEYKDSGVSWLGNIPALWNIVKTKRHFQNEKRVAGKYANQYERLALTMNGVIKRDKEDAEGLQPESFEGYQVLEQNQLVFKLIDLENVKTSRVGLSPYTGIVSPAYIILHNDQQDNRFYYYYYMNMYYQEIFNYLGGEGVRSALNAKDLLETPIPDIPLKQQKVIADYLDGECVRIDGIVTTQRQIIERLKEYKKSVITEAITRGLNPEVPMKDSGIEWIGRIPASWEAQRIKSAFDFFKGLPITKENLKESGLAVLSYGQVHAKNNDFVSIKEHLLRFVDEDYKKYSQAKVNKFDFVFADTSEDLDGCGNCCYKRDDSELYAGYHTLVLRSKHKKDNRFFAYLFTTDIWRQQIRTKVSGVKLFSVTQRILSQTSIIIPSDKEQKEIADYLDRKCSEIDSIIEKRERMIELMTEYKKSLIYECVTGKKEIVDVME